MLLVAAAVPSITMLSMRLVPVDDDAPLKRIRNAAFALSFSPIMLDNVNTNGIEPKAVAGT
jgi:hypothetical protein